MNLVQRTIEILKPALKDKQVQKLLLINVLIVLIAIAGIFGIVVWREFFINSIQNKDAIQFALLTGIFTLIAGVVVVARGFQSYVAKLIEFRARTVLFQSYLSRLNAAELSLNTPNLEQRLAQDTALIPKIAGSITFGVLEAVVNIVVFGVMTYIAGPWFTIPALVIYVAVGMVFAKKIGSPLTKLDYEQQTREARLYRAIIDWINSKKTTNQPDLSEVAVNWSELARRSKLLGFFTSGHGQIGNILPMVLLAPVYFSGAITMGSLWSASDAAGRLTDSMAYLIDRRDDINMLTACIIRLEEVT